MKTVKVDFAGESKDFPLGVSLLLYGPVASGKTTFSLTLAREFLRNGLSCIWVCMDESPTSIQEKMAYFQVDYQVSKQMNLLRFIDVYSEQITGKPLNDPGVINCSSAFNLNEINRALMKAISEVKNQGLVIFDSLSTLLLYNRSGTAEEFLKVHMSRITSAGFAGIFILQRDLHDPQTEETMKMLCESALEFGFHKGTRRIGILKLPLGASGDWIESSLFAWQQPRNISMSAPAGPRKYMDSGGYLEEIKDGLKEGLIGGLREGLPQMKVQSQVRFDSSGLKQELIDGLKEGISNAPAKAVIPSYMPPQYMPPPASPPVYQQPQYQPPPQPQYAPSQSSAQPTTGASQPQQQAPQQPSSEASGASGGPSPSQAQPVASTSQPLQSGPASIVGDIKKDVSEPLRIPTSNIDTKALAQALRNEMAGMPSMPQMASPSPVQHIDQQIVVANISNLPDQLAEEIRGLLGEQLSLRESMSQTEQLTKDHKEKLTQLATHEDKTSQEVREIQSHKENFNRELISRKTALGELLEQKKLAEANLKETLNRHQVAKDNVESILARKKNLESKIQDLVEGSGELQIDLVPYLEKALTKRQEEVNASKEAAEKLSLKVASISSEVIAIEEDLNRVAKTSETKMAELEDVRTKRQKVESELEHITSARGETESRLNEIMAKKKELEKKLSQMSRGPK
jgi:KaiC/GvpD/RAD55 family RecA-like ATPase